MRGPRLLKFLDEYTPLDADDKRVIAAKGLAITRATLKSILIIGALQGTLGGLAFAAAGIDGPVFWGIVMAVASTLPAVGPRSCGCRPRSCCTCRVNPPSLSGSPRGARSS